MSSTSENPDMARNDTKAEQGYEDSIAVFEVFPTCQHILHTDNKLLVVNPEIRNIEFVLNNAPCPHCNQKDELLTIHELLEHCRGALGEALYDRTEAGDDFDTRAHRWELDIVYIEQVIWAFDDQLKDPSLEFVYENHLHNARQQYESRLQSLRRSKGTAEVIYLSRRHHIHSEWAKMQGEHLGRTWVDMAKPETKAPVVSLAPGDISITLPSGNELESIIDSTRIAGKLHYRVKYVGNPVVSKWLPLADFLGEEVLLYKYHKERPRKASPREKDWKQARARMW